MKGYISCIGPSSQLDIVYIDKGTSLMVHHGGLNEVEDVLITYLWEIRRTEGEGNQNP